MSIIQFSHANGFPAKTYTKLFDNLNEYKISTINNLGENTNAADINWYDLTDEILESVDKIGEPVIGVGHSFGGVLTLLAAAKKPELFHDIILLDPPLFSSHKRCLIRLLRALNIEDWVSPSGKSKRRRDHFDSKSQAKSFFQANKLFKNFNPQVLNDYVTHGLTDGKNDVVLTISVEKELAIFHKMLTSFPQDVYKVKCTLVYAAKNPILWRSDLSWIIKKFLKLQVIPFPGSHLFPLENPESTALMIKRCL
jgi:pimeloyl-ACP methyl ester carboxylesterase